MVKWLITIVVCVAVTAGLALFKINQIRSAIAFAESFPEPAETVQVALAENTSWVQTANVVAEVLAVQSVDFSTELAGRIVEVGFAPGAEVKQGQLLVRLDSSEERAQLAGARAEAELARLALERNQKLIVTGAASTEARDLARAQFNAATAVVDQLAAVIEKMTLRAPFNAVAGLHELEPGQYLNAGTSIVWLVGASDEVWIDFRLPQQQARSAVGDSVVVSAASLVDGEFTASIIAKDSYVERQSRSVRYRARADNRQGALFPGSLVSVTVGIGQSISAVRLPDTAIRRDAFGANVFLLEPAEPGAQAEYRARRIPVKLGYAENQTVIVIEGLEGGERIAADGSFKLRDGVLVHAARSVAGSKVE